MATSSQDGHEEQPPLAVTVSDDAGTTVVAVSGELDLATVPALQRAFEGIGPHAQQVVVDLDAVTFLGSTGLNALLQAQLEMGTHGCALRVRTASPFSQRVIELAGLSEVLGLHDGAGPPSAGGPGG